jgi:hypothetical protein
MKQLLKILGEEIDYARHSLTYQLRQGRKVVPAKVLVNGSPKTGTTWMMRLITSIPGYHQAGNFQGEIQRYRQVEPGQVVHGHDHYTPELGEILNSSQIKVVLMIRDPRDQVVSRVFHLRRDVTNRVHQMFQQLPDDEAVMMCIEGAKGVRSARDLICLTQSWLDSGMEIVCVRYEDLIARPQAEFKRVLQFINNPLPDAFVASIVQRNRFERLTVGKKIWKSWRTAGQADPNSHFRKGIVGDWRNYFNEAHRQRFKEIAGATLIEMGYEQGWDW